MVGVRDPFGIALCLLLAAGGLLVGMWGSPVVTSAADLLRRHPAVDELVVVARRSVGGGLLGR